MKKIALFVVLFSCIFCLGCGGRIARMPNPVLSYVPSDDTLNCEQLKEEMAKIKRDIALVVPLAKAQAKDPSNKTEKRSRKAEKIEIQALKDRHNNLLMIAYKNGCVVGGLSTDYSNTPNAIVPMCKYCGPSKCKQWHIVNGESICDVCYKKHGSK